MIRELVNYYKKFDASSLSKKAYRLLILLIWTQYTLFSYFQVILNRLPIINIFSNYIFPLLVCVLVLLAWKEIKNSLSIKDLLFYLSLIFTLLMTLWLFPNNAEYLNGDMIRITTGVIPFYFIGLFYDHNESKDDLFYFSLLGVCVALLYQIYYLATGRELSTDNMNAAYKLLPSVLFLIYSAFNNNKKIYWIFPMLGILLEFIYGTRGPILIIALYSLVMIYFKMKTKKINTKYLLVCIILFSLFLFMLVSGMFTTIMEKMSDFFESMGFSTRIFDYFLSGNIADDNGRDELTTKIISSIIKNPFGYGVYSDRVIIGNYAHNIFLEIWCHFGVFIGTILLLFLFFIPVKAILIEKHKNLEVFFFLIMFYIMVYFKLLLSNSYILETNLFFLLGCSIGIIRNYSGNKYKL